MSETYVSMLNSFEEIANKLGKEDVVKDIEKEKQRVGIRESIENKEENTK